MDLRLKFNEDEVNYDEYRPTYIAKLFDDVLSYSNTDISTNSLEIGIGTGQATVPFLKTGCSVTAIEIGEKLSEYSKKKFSTYSNLNVVNIDFESFESKDNQYDLIYSATAFHWIPQEIGFSKVHQILKHGGTVALFWNHPFVNCDDDMLHLEIRKIYNKHKPSDDKSPTEFNESSCKRYATILKQFGFVDVEYRIYRQTRQMNADDYISLLNTYSDHRALQSEIKVGLEEDIVNAINSLGGKLSIYDTMDLYLARKF